MTNLQFFTSTLRSRLSSLFNLSFNLFMRLLFRSCALCLLMVMQAQANLCGDPDMYRGGSYHSRPFTLVELKGPKEAQLELMLKQFNGQWRGDGVEIKCSEKGMGKSLFRIEASGEGDKTEAELRLHKKYEEGSSTVLFELFLKDGLLRHKRASYSDLGLSKFDKDTLEFSVRSGGRTRWLTYWRIQFSRKVGSRYKKMKIEKSFYNKGGLLGAESWDLKRL